MKPMFITKGDIIMKKNVISDLHDTVMQEVMILIRDENNDSISDWYSLELISTKLKAAEACYETDVSLLKASLCEKTKEYAD
jgi:hypothetical protein